MNKPLKQASIWHWWAENIIELKDVSYKNVPSDGIDPRYTFILKVSKDASSNAEFAPVSYSDEFTNETTLLVDHIFWREVFVDVYWVNREPISFDTVSQVSDSQVMVTFTAPTSWYIKLT